MFLYVFVAPHRAYIWLSSAVHSVVVKQLFTIYSTSARKTFERFRRMSKTKSHATRPRRYEDTRIDSIANSLSKSKLLVVSSR